MFKQVTIPLQPKLSTQVRGPVLDFDHELGPLLETKNFLPIYLVSGDSIQFTYTLTHPLSYKKSLIHELLYDATGTEECYGAEIRANGIVPLIRSSP